MSRRRKDPLRCLTEAERTQLSRLSRLQHVPAAQVGRQAPAAAAPSPAGRRHASAGRLGRPHTPTVRSDPARPGQP